MKQTLREEFQKEFSGTHSVKCWAMEECNCEPFDLEERKTCEVKIAEFFLARFKEFAEKVIGEDEKLKPECSEPNCWCSTDIHGRARNALRNEQRKILSEKLK